MFFSGLKTSRVRVRVAIVVLLGATLLGTVASTAAYAQTEAEKAFVATGDALCKKGNERLAQQALAFERHRLISRKAAKSVNQRVAKPADVAEFVEKFAAKAIEIQLGELGSLKPPPSQAAAFAAALKEANRALADIKAKPNEAAYRNSFQKSAKMMSALGFRSCGQAESRSSSV